LGMNPAMRFTARCSRVRVSMRKRSEPKSSPGRQMALKPVPDQVPTSGPSGSSEGVVSSETGAAAPVLN
jgi:hypothetical protein